MIIIIIIIITIIRRRATTTITNNSNNNNKNNNNSNNPIAIPIGEDMVFIVTVSLNVLIMWRVTHYRKQ